MTQSYLINIQTKTAVIPIMRNASSMLEFVLKKDGWVITKDRYLSADFTYYTVWRDPYERLISALQRELCEVYDQNLHRTHAAVDAQMNEWSNDPQSIVDLNHTISQYDTCVDIMPTGSQLHVYPYAQISSMLFAATGKLHNDTPKMNVSADYPPLIVELWQEGSVYTREPLWMSGWCRKEFSKDYDVWERLLKADTLSIIEEY